MFVQKVAELQLSVLSGPLSCDFSGDLSTCMHIKPS